MDWTYHFAPSTPGQYIITYEGQFTVHDTIIVLPPYPNIALGKPVTASSHENAGTLPEGINDGDLSTRWGSAHNDNEYITINLLQSCFIDHITLHWETAYANSFALLITDTIPDLSPFSFHLSPFSFHNCPASTRLITRSTMRSLSAASYSSFRSFLNSLAINCQKLALAFPR